MHGTAKWAQSGAGRRPAWQDGEESEESGSGDSGEDDAGSDGEGEGDDDLGAVLRSNAPLLGGGAEGGVGSPHPKGRLSIQRVRNLNQAAPSKAVVRALEFHRSGQLALTAGLDKTLRLFQVRPITPCTARPKACALTPPVWLAQVDGKHNPKVQGVHFADTPITSAAFTTGGGARDEVVCTGRRKHFYVYDLGSGKATKVPRIEGEQQQQRGWTMGHAPHTR